MELISACSSDFIMAKEIVLRVAIISFVHFQTHPQHKAAVIDPFCNN